MNATQVLMCPPKYFEVNYVINPWMQRGAVRLALANQQWERLRAGIAAHAEVVLLDPRPGLPDMVFTANAGVVIDDRVMASHFQPHERRAEEAHFKDWFCHHGYTLLELPDYIGFEGAGDCLYDAGRTVLWTGLGLRSEPEVLVYLNRAFGFDIVALRLADPHYYHLDTCFCPLSGGHVLYFPEAFHPTSRAEIERRVAPEKRIAVSAADAGQFACNAVNLGREVFMHRASEPLRAALEQAGYRLHEYELSEFLKAGGSAKCLTLRLDAPPALSRHARAA